MSNVQYVRAGACTAGSAINTRLVKCAVEMTDCPAGSNFWSSSQLTKALQSEAATCLQAAQTNQVLSGQCSTVSTTTTGSCLVENFEAEDVYQCAVSKDACASGDLYLSASQTTASGGVTCKLCGLPASMDYDLRDVTSDKSILDSLFGTDDSSKQLEAVGIAGIVLGFVAGCALLICFQRMCCRRNRNAKNNMDTTMPTSGDPDAFDKPGNDASADATESDHDTKEMV